MKILITHEVQLRSCLGLGTDVLAGVVYMSETDGPEEVLADGKLLGHWEKCRPVDGSAPGFRPGDAVPKVCTVVP